MKKFIEVIISRFFCLLGFHSHESGEIDDGTFSDVSGWCADCGNPL